MSARILPRYTWRVVLPIVAGALLAGMPAQVTLAQQAEAANAGAAAHTAPTGEHKGGRFQAPQLTRAPAKERPIIHGGASVTDHNAIGISIVRPDGGQKPTGFNLGRALTLAPPVSPAPSGAALGLGGSALNAPHVPAPAPRPLVFSRGTINGGAVFTRPGTALAPLGGPAKQAATGINGTRIQPKH
jgi:hypothetical protein